MRSWLVVSESAEEVMAAGVRWLEKGQGQASVDADLSGLDDRLPARVFLALELGELLGRAGHHLVADGDELLAHPGIVERLDKGRMGLLPPPTPHPLPPADPPPAAPLHPLPPR